MDTDQKKAKCQERRNRIAVIVKLISQGKRDGEIKRLCSQSWKIKSRSVEKYITIARAKLREDLGLSLADLRADMVSKLEAIAFSKSTNPLTALRALENVSKILGLYQPLGLVVTPAHRSDNTEAVNARAEVFGNPQYLDYLRQQAAKEDQGASDDRTGDDPIDSDSGPVWEDSVEGAAESSTVA